MAANDYAIVIGISHYNGIAPLSSAVHDATAFHDWLTKPDGGDVPAANCYLISSNPNPLRPIQDDIDDCVIQVFQQLDQAHTKARRLYLYFSGHGLGINWDETAMVLPKWSKYSINSALSSPKYLNELVKSGYFEEIFFFLDCCRNRYTSVAAGPYFGNGQQSGNSQSVVFLATEFDNVAMGQPVSSSTSLDNALPRGFFTKALINGLKGAAADSKGQVSVSSLQVYLTLALKQDTLSSKQKPSVHSSLSAGNDIVICNSKVVADVPVTITFTQPGVPAILEDGNLNVIKQDATFTGKWEIKLPKGLYTIRYQDTDTGKYIRIEGIEKEAKYEL